MAPSTKPPPAKQQRPASDESSKSIYTASGEEIRWYGFDIRNHLDRVTVLAGGSGSGKSCIVEHLLYMLKEYVPNIIVITPGTSGDEYRSKLPAKCIKPDVTKEYLINLWQRQQYATAIYKIAQDINHLKEVFDLAPNAESKVMLKSIEVTTKQMIQTISASGEMTFAQKKTSLKNIEDLYIQKCKEIYRDAIRQNRRIFERMLDRMNENQKVVVKFLDFNPKLLIVMDDISEKFGNWMKYFKKNEMNPLEALFYRGRHNHISLLLAIHDDKIITTELRKNARVTIYTTSQSAITSLMRTGNGYSSEQKKKVTEYISTIFNDEDVVDPTQKKHQKLCYVREDPHPFRYTIADTHSEFVIGSAPMRELINKFPQPNESISDNPFYKEQFGGK